MRTAHTATQLWGGRLQQFTSMGDPSMYNLLTVVDETLAHHISDADFDASLVHHVLFQNHALLHEGYLGDSTLMFAHIRRADEENRKPLVLAAMEEGIIVPAVNEGGSNPVKEMFSRLKERYTVKHPIFHSENASIHQALFRALNIGFQRGFQPFFVAYKYSLDSLGGLPRHVDCHATEGQLPLSTWSVIRGGVGRARQLR
jgi:hypothetical protein